MKHKSKLRAPQFVGARMSDFKSVYHPLSHYLDGGVDMTGEALDKSATVEYDNEDQLSELESQGASSVALGDPRIGFLDIAEQAGAKKAAQATSATPKPSADANSTVSE